LKCFKPPSTATFPAPFRQFNAFIFRIARLLRILQLEDFVESFTLLDDAWRSCRETMVATGSLPEMAETDGKWTFSRLRLKYGGFMRFPKMEVPQIVQS
jgi:hypothetical protein